MIRKKTISAIIFLPMNTCRQLRMSKFFLLLITLELYISQKEKVNICAFKIIYAEFKIYF